MATNTPSTDIPSLDIDLLRAEKGGRPDLVRDNERKRYNSTNRVDRIIELDTKWRQTRFNGDKWNKIKRIVSTQVY